MTWFTEPRRKAVLNDVTQLGNGARRRRRDQRVLRSIAQQAKSAGWRRLALRQLPDRSDCSTVPAPLAASLTRSFADKDRRDHDDDRDQKATRSQRSSSDA